jgi:hypothetical protein
MGIVPRLSACQLEARHTEEMASGLKIWLIEESNPD